MAIGWFGEDIVDAVDSVASDAGAVVRDAWDLVDDLPVLKQLGEGTKAVFTGPLRDFARTGLGQTILRAMTTVAMGPIGWVAGPWAMMVSASLPGIARGDSFEEALFSENLWRLSKTAEVLGTDYAGELVAQYGTALEELKKRARAVAPDLDVPDALQELASRAGLDPEAYARKLAASLGIREDMAAQAFEMLGRVQFFNPDAYDVATGKQQGIVRLRFGTRVGVRNDQIDRVLDALDPGRDFRQAARSTSAGMFNPSPGLAIFRQERAAATPAPPRPGTERSAVGTLMDLEDAIGSPALAVGIGVALVGGAVLAARWYARR